MPKQGYSGLLSEEEVLGLLVRGIYHACPKTGTITGRRGMVITPAPDYQGRYFVRLYHGGKSKCIARARLVWMAAAQRLIPEGFEIHHIDEDNQNDIWDNLICIYDVDHHKLHRDSEDATSLADVPF